MFSDEEFDRSYRNTDRFSTGLLIVQAILILCVWGGVIAGIFYAAKEIKASGVKGLVEKVWNGPDFK
ncbi:MAG: hypothetical protein PHR35_08630 [Kiritimatiellae bacterium]|nr:hypothetical protein [Kiritimatiellia bacterium]